VKTKIEDRGLNKETRSPGGNRFMASWVPYKIIPADKMPSSIVAFKTEV
jgi:hypothetical protein